MIALWLGCAAPGPVPDVPFELPVADAARVRFLAVGDTGKGNAGQRAVAAGMARVCAELGCDFVLLLGDNLYPDGMLVEEDPRMDLVFTEIYGSLEIPFALVLGNHDWGRTHHIANAERQIRWARARDQPRLPERYYRFQAGSIEFWAVDTDSVLWEGEGDQGAWLDRTLRTSEADWRVVFGHHPFRSNGDHGNAGGYEGWTWLPYLTGEALDPFFRDHLVGNAHVYLAGHDHNLQSIHHDGLELVVSGAGATARSVVDRGNRPELAFDSLGFAWIELSETMDLRFFDAQGELLGSRVAPRPEIHGGRSR